MNEWTASDDYDRMLSNVNNNGHLPFSSSLDRNIQPTYFNPAAPAINAWRAAVPTQPALDVLPKSDPGFDFADPARTTSFTSPRGSGSPTPSLCDDGPTVVKKETASPTTPQAESKNAKRSISASSEEVEEPAAKRIPRKRGRPRLNHAESDPAAYSSSTHNSAKQRCNRRLPHNQVERKYREGLNAELERLRKAVPTLPQRDTDSNGPPKPSKATVLASAIDYIKFIEADRDRLLEELEGLRGVPTTGNQSSKLRGYGWNRPQSGSSSPVSFSGQ